MWNRIETGLIISYLVYCDFIIGDSTHVLYICLSSKYLHLLRWLFFFCSVATTIWIGFVFDPIKTARLMASFSMYHCGTDNIGINIYIYIKKKFSYYDNPGLKVSPIFPPLSLFTILMCSLSLLLKPKGGWGSANRTISCPHGLSLSINS